MSSVPIVADLTPAAVDALRHVDAWPEMDRPGAPTSWVVEELLRARLIEWDEITQRWRATRSPRP